MPRKKPEAKVTAAKKVQLRAVANFDSPLEGKVKLHNFLWVAPERVHQLVDVVKCCVVVTDARRQA